MAVILDGHRHIATGITADVERFYDSDAMSERITEWLETPEGSVADLPHWGHNLEGFKHDPQGPQLEVLIEMSIARKLTRDIKDLVLLGVGVEYLDIDLFKVLIRHQFGGAVGTLQL